ASDGRRRARQRADAVLVESLGRDHRRADAAGQSYAGDRERTAGGPGGAGSGAARLKETRRRGDKEKGRPGEGETGRRGDREKGRQGRPGEGETGRRGDRRPILLPVSLSPLLPFSLSYFFSAFRRV